MFLLIEVDAGKILAISSAEKTFAGEWGWLQQEGKAVWRSIPDGIDPGEVFVDLSTPGDPQVVVDAAKKAARDAEKKTKEDAKKLLTDVDWSKVKTLDDLIAIVRALVNR
jgi:hypothetical protein